MFSAVNNIEVLDSRPTSVTVPVAPMYTEKPVEPASPVQKEVPAEYESPVEDTTSESPVEDNTDEIPQEGATPRIRSSMRKTSRSDTEKVEIKKDISKPKSEENNEWFSSAGDL